MEVKTKKAKEQKQGVLKRIAGPVVKAVNLDAHMYDVVKVGKEALMGEVIKIQGDSIIIQVYEDTSGIRPGEPVKNTGLSLAVELGPGLLTSIYDGWLLVVWFWDPNYLYGIGWQNSTSMLFMIIMYALGAVIYFGFSAYRRRQGIDVNKVYQNIPVE